MKRQSFLIGMIAVFVAEIIALIVYAVYTPELKQDVVAVNEIVKSVERDFDSLDEHVNSAPLDYVVCDVDGNILYRTRSGLSENINAAIVHRDTILDIERDGETVGKVIIYNSGATEMSARKRSVVTALIVAIVVEFGVCMAYAAYMYITVVKPFRKLKGFAERVADGNLDIPLEMDKRNIFGAFTESFDVMRSELKKARIAEAQAQQSKKELVAKLSHDIKTPVASIKAVSEVGLTLAETQKDRENYTRIIEKTDQINSLVTNLFTATLEELHQLTVMPAAVDGRTVKKLLENADYLHKSIVPDIPECSVYADALRLQQVFDNIFANSYKYAKTDIVLTVEKTDNNLHIAVEDFGGGVKNEELAVLKEKFKRGSNAANIDGAGLGLYISDYFMNEMNGELTVENGTHGLKVTVSLALCR